jgi:hypothetical protein
MKLLWIFAISVVSAFLVFDGARAYAQAEIDPDHFDEPGMVPIQQPRTSESKVTITLYERTFSLPYNVSCNGQKLAPGKYFISIRSDGKVANATLKQRGRVIQLPTLVQTEAPKRGDEALIVENDNSARLISAVRVSGLAFVFDPKHSADPSPRSVTPHTERLPLIAVAKKGIANEPYSPGPSRP